jgi:hypothetical protein
MPVGMSNQTEENSPNRDAHIFYNFIFLLGIFLVFLFFISQLTYMRFKFRLIYVK